MDAYLSGFEDPRRYIHFQLVQGDITDEDTQAVVVFRHRQRHGFGSLLKMRQSYNDTAEGDSLRVLQEAGDGIKDEYQKAKADGGRHVVRGVVLTGAGKLTHPRHIFHLLTDDNPVKLKDTLVAALRLADKQGIKSIAFPSLQSSEKTIETMLESFEEFAGKDRPICLNLIQVVIGNDTGLSQYMEISQRSEMKLYMDLAIRRIKSGKELGGGESRGQLGLFAHHSKDI